MDNQKDTQKTALNSYGHIDVSHIKSLQNNALYNHANKKTEKLVTALYMVTDCMDTDDALKGKLRLLGVELLSNTHKLPTINPVDKNTHIHASLTSIHEILSFMEIAYTIGYISEMNTNILKREFNSLTKDLQSHLSKDKHFTFTLDENMFTSGEEENIKEEEVEKSTFLKNSIGQSYKKTNTSNLSFNTYNGSQIQSSHIKNSLMSVSSPLIKEERGIKILSLIKDKKDISIKDISTAFTDCSEKTIQRELANLVSKGQIKKSGEKRWSRYQII